ncbi:cytochrome P450 [Aspergillus venezuelensis]
MFVDFLIFLINILQFPIFQGFLVCALLALVYDFFSGLYGHFPKIVLPNRFADEIRNHPDLHFGKAISRVSRRSQKSLGIEFFGDYPGSTPFAATTTSQVIVRGRLTQSLNLITEELADETAKAGDGLFGEPEITRVSLRVLQISREYATNAFVGARVLRQWHFFLRPFIHWFLPECRKVRATLAEARRVIQPVIQQRRQDNHEARMAGKSMSKTSDTIGWLDEAAMGRPYDAAVPQLGLSFAAIHTTTEMVSGLISDLCANPEYFEPLRGEMALALGDEGWSKKALHGMRLLDSVMMESQRHHFGDIAAMHRTAEKQITLSDGARIPKGAFTMVAIDGMHDAKILNDPSAFNGRRFLQLRKQAGQENRWQFAPLAVRPVA